MISDEEFDILLREKELNDKKARAKAKWVIYGGIGAFILIMYLIADESHKEAFNWWIIGAVVYFAVDSRLAAIQDALSRIENKLNR